MGDVSIIARRLEDGHVQYGCKRSIASTLTTISRFCGL